MNRYFLTQKQKHRRENNDSYQFCPSGQPVRYFEVISVHVADTSDAKTGSAVTGVFDVQNFGWSHLEQLTGAMKD
jgi:hypothetical protein